jgi:uncharacterized protein (TIGR03067 family)
MGKTTLKMIAAALAVATFSMGAAVLVQQAVADAKDDLAKKDRDALQGTWLAITHEIGGTAIDLTKIEKAKDWRWEIKGNKLVNRIKGAAEDGTFKLDPGKDPKHIDLKFEKEGKPNAGIYALDGDTLKICYDIPGQDRPKGFTTEKGPKVTIWTFKKKAK